MGLIVDLILIIAGVAIIVGGWKNGFFKTVMSFAAWVIAVLAAWLFTPVLSSALRGVVYSAVSGKIADSVAAALSNINTEGMKCSDLMSRLPECMDKIAGRFSIDTTAIDAKLSEYSQTTGGDSSAISEYISGPLADFLSGVLAFVIIFIVVITVLSILIHILNKLFRLPVLNTLNKTLGLMLGIVCAVAVTATLGFVSANIIDVIECYVPKLYNLRLVDTSILLPYFADGSFFEPIKEALFVSSV